MKREVFCGYLDRATGAAHRFGRSFVFNPLPPASKFRLQCCTEEVGAETTYARDEVVRKLWVDGKVPRWIDINLQDHDKTHSIFLLVYAEDSLEIEEDTFYFARGMGPFGIKSPYLPPDHVEGRSLISTGEQLE